MHTVIYQLSPLKTEFKSIQFKPPEKARAVGYHGDVRCVYLRRYQAAPAERH